MNTLHFKYAVEVERSGSITHAADNLLMAQPNLSKAIRELEDGLGISIFKRTSKGVTPTPKGAEFLLYAKRVLAEIDKMDSLMHSDHSDEQKLTLSIPRSSYISQGFIQFVNTLDLEKEMELQIKETNSLEAIHNILDGQYNLAIIRYQLLYENYFLDYLVEKDLCYDLLWEFNSLVVMSKFHPLAAAKEVKADALQHYIEIIYGDTVIPYINTIDSKRSSAVPSSKRVRVYERGSQFDLLSQIPRTYMWVSPIPEELLKRHDLILRKCQSLEHQYKDLLIYPKGYELKPLEKTLIDKLYASKNEVAFKQYE